MTKAKKAIGIILAVVMLASMFAFSSFAAGAGNATFTVEPSAAQVDVGDTITVSVKLTTDYYAGPTSVPIYYDAALFDYVAGSLTNAEIYGAGATDVTSYNNNGCLTVAFVPKSAASGVKAQVLNNVTLFTFQLTAKANGVSPVELKAADQKATGNMTGKLYCGSYANSNVTSAVTSIGQTFTLKNSSVTIGASAAPELQLSEYGAEMGAVIVKTENYAGYNGCVFGIDTPNGEEIEAYLTTPTGSIAVLENEEGYNNATGAVINLLDDEGNVVESYVFILFGDVDGNGFPDSVDAGLIAEAEVGMAEFAFDYCELAADFDGNGFYDSVDAGYVAEYEVGLYEASQAEIAAEVLNNYSF